jgi:hypothetical protein
MDMSPGSPPLQSSAQPVVKALNCPQCGAAINLRALGQAVSVVCDSCHSILDAKDPHLQILQKFEKIVSPDRPLIPLGTRGKMRGTEYEAVGFQRRSLKADGIPYYWHEYVLFNPYKGFRYLTEYQGHWNDVAVCKEQPVVDPRISTPLDASYLGEFYQHFQTVDAITEFVLGEFPWEVRVGEQARITDYIHPPRALSKEQTSGEVSWSIGEYIQARDIWNAFRLSDDPPEVVGVFENQPSRIGTNVTALWTAFALFALGLLVLLIGFDATAKRQSVFLQSYQINPGPQVGEPSFVTDTFELSGRTSSVEITTYADVANSWIYVNYALINQETGQAWDFGREVSYYHGSDSGGSWSEGNQRDRVIVPSVPPGHYYLRIEPEVDPRHPRINYSVEVTRDVPVAAFYGIGFLALLAPPLFLAWRSISFERSRWSESDHPPTPILNTGSD